MIYNFSSNLSTIYHKYKNIFSDLFNDISDIFIIQNVVVFEIYKRCFKSLKIRLNQKQNQYLVNVKLLSMTLNLISFTFRIQYNVMFFFVIEDFKLNLNFKFHINEE